MICASGADVSEAPGIYRDYSRPSPRAPSPALAECDQLPPQFAISGNLKPGYAGRCAPIRARHASRIQKEHTFPPFVSGNVGMTVQKHVDIFRRAIGRNVHQPKPEAVAFQINHQRPFGIAVAIPAHNRHRRTDVLQRLQKARGANVPEMPDFIRPFRQRIDVRRQMIVCIRENEYFHLRVDRPLRGRCWVNAALPRN